MPNKTKRAFTLSACTLAAYQHVEKISARADYMNGRAPMWYGWAVREAFEAGAAWQFNNKTGRTHDEVAAS